VVVAEKIESNKLQKFNSIISGVKLNSFIQTIHRIPFGKRGGAITVN